METLNPKMHLSYKFRFIEYLNFPAKAAGTAEPGGLGGA